MLTKSFSWILNSKIKSYVISYLHFSSFPNCQLLACFVPSYSAFLLWKPVETFSTIQFAFGKTASSFLSKVDQMTVSLALFYFLKQKIASFHLFNFLFMDENAKWQLCWWNSLFTLRKLIIGPSDKNAATICASQVSQKIGKSHEIESWKPKKPLSFCLIVRLIPN